MLLISEYIQIYLDTTLRDKVFRRSLNCLKKRLNEYDPELKIDSFSPRVSEGFIKFLKSHSKQYKTNTINNYFQMLSAILNKASKEYRVNSGYKSIRILSEDIFTVYLTQKEIKELEAKKLNRTIAVTRDYFIIMCYTGLRFGDVKRLCIDNIIDDKIVVKMQNLNRIVEIPLHPSVIKILNNWRWQFPPFVT